jgi:hypothetical protein
MLHTKQPVSNPAVPKHPSSSEISSSAPTTIEPAEFSLEEHNNKEQIAEVHQPELQPIPNFQVEQQKLQPISSPKVVVQEVNQNADLTVNSDCLQPQLCSEQTNVLDCQVQLLQACCPENQVKVSCELVQKLRKKALPSCTRSLTCKQKINRMVKPRTRQQAKLSRKKVQGQAASQASKQTGEQSQAGVPSSKKGQSRCKATGRRSKFLCKGKSRKESSSVLSLHPQGNYLKWMRKTDFYLQLSTVLLRHDYKKSLSTHSTGSG